jgi:hypothetical protein
MARYVDAGGVKTWFDSWGAGAPLILLHGDLVTNAHMGTDGARALGALPDPGP